ncbi:gap junction delta-4 protein [Phascolarctos cinereus]|uniref:Gap junction protein n=1 Tax=Phascolarctos cinereus TaxID=38626 RepID=A0A6P5KLX1_PHACI|nr:gap junction delta-4 protein [Phascolarctos cinereus]
MERWDLLGFLIITLNCNVTILGKIWLIFTIMLRMVVIILAGYPIYQDEQERFVCNTLQPGCSNVCYDMFSPVSHFRFWLIQNVSVLLPYTMFSVYVLHKGALHAALGAHQPDCCKGRHSLFGQRAVKGLYPRPCCFCLNVPDFSTVYIIQLLLRILTEAAFVGTQYYLFGFWVPKRFSCYHSPCTSVVDCYISRPTEKSIMMLFIWGVNALSFLLSFVDLTCSMQRWLRRKHLAKQVIKNACVSEEHGSPNISPGEATNCLASEVEQEPPHLVKRSSQTSENCEWPESRGEDVSLHPMVWPKDVASRSNLNSPSNKSCSSGRMAFPDEEGSEVMSSGSEQHGIAPKQLQGRLVKEMAQAPRPKDSPQLEEHASAPRSRLGGHYSSRELKPSASQVNCGSPSYLRAKKFEWV